MPEFVYAAYTMNVICLGGLIIFVGLAILFAIAWCLGFIDMAG